mmetsp:Transcript_22222/g.43234  ORF Transcript_22222/g.43234 Transcript_22222/m.43234 type:complete len:257 (-) Transcript_22222:72-842(-)
MTQVKGVPSGPFAIISSPGRHPSGTLTMIVFGFGLCRGTSTCTISPPLTPSGTVNLKVCPSGLCVLITCPASTPSGKLTYTLSFLATPLMPPDDGGLFSGGGVLLCCCCCCSCCHPASGTLPTAILFLRSFATWSIALGGCCLPPNPVRPSTASRPAAAECMLAVLRSSERETTLCPSDTSSSSSSSIDDDMLSVSSPAIPPVQSGGPQSPCPPLRPAVVVWRAGGAPLVLLLSGSGRWSRPIQSTAAEPRSLPAS